MISAYAVLYLEINLISVILVGIILYKTQGLSKMVAQRWFSVAIISEMIFFLSDTYYVMMNIGAMPYIKAAALACKEIYFFFTVAMCFFWFLYFEYMQDVTLMKDRKRRFLSSALLWIIALLLIINLFTGILFYIDDVNEYHRGPLFIVQYVLAYIYVFAGCIRPLVTLIKNHDRSHRDRLLSLAVFPVAPAIAGILQYRAPHLPLACAVLALETLILYLSWTDQIISIDPLTKLNNRKQLAHHYDQWARTAGDSEDMYLLLIDANRFKCINDTWGHTQGDEALKRIAEALRRSCQGLQRRANIARYGGDEFVILMEADAESAAEEVKQRINRILSELNSEAGAPYPLSVSVGIARAKPTIELKDMIVMADEKMYEEKERSRK